MARPESIALGGYFPAPTHVVAQLAKLITFDPVHHHSGKVVDPCAGQGEAILELMRHYDSMSLYACELEIQRAEILKKAVGVEFTYSQQHIIQGDAFRLKFSASACLLYLNPPYDTDPIHGRLEQKFLERFTNSLLVGGALVFLVPHYALKASADFLARNYEDIQCYLFPEADFEIYKQVVLIAKRKDISVFDPDPAVVGRVERWASDSTTITKLEDAPIGAIEVSEVSYSMTWELQPLDYEALKAKAKPWMQSTKGGLMPVPHTIPEGPVDGLIFREFPVATSPRPAHIAAGIASGLFNGHRVTARGRPPLLVKGVFDREFITIEEKVNKEGVTSSIVQVQQPKLVVTTLNLRTKIYETLDSAGVETLLGNYGPSLLQVMQKQCPVSYDPKRDAESLPLATLAREPYPAQAHAGKALLGLLGGAKASPDQRRYKGAILLGEIGSGKTSTVLSVGAVFAKRILVLCPPHLLASWSNEVAAILPQAQIRVLQTITDVDELATDRHEGLTIAILSRETAKLGHGWESVTKACPKCGNKLPTGNLAKKRARCKTAPLVPGNVMAVVAHELALKIAPSAPNNHLVEQILQGRHMQNTLKRYRESTPKVWEGLNLDWIRGVLAEVPRSSENAELIAQLLLVEYDEAQISKVIFECIDDNWSMHDLARALTLMLAPRSAAQEVAEKVTFTQGWASQTLEVQLERAESEDGYHTTAGVLHWKVGEGRPTLDKKKADSVEFAQAILANLVRLGSFPKGKECGEHLYQAVAKPRRYSIAKYISQRYPNLFDCLVLDECHEFQNEDTAQSHAAHRLTTLGIPTILMTGSIMNGYASSLFTNMWAVSPDFRREFARNEKVKFVERYGYHKRVLTDRDRESKNVIEFGSQTDRVERSERKAGDAPGVLPLFLFRHLLSISVTLHKADLALDLPECRQIRVGLTPEPELLKSYKQLQTQLIGQIKRDRREEGLSGKLFGALSELPSYLDRCTRDTGNQDDGSYEVHYPATVKDGGLVAQGHTFDAGHITTKEQWMLDTLERELAEGRNIMICCWHVVLLPRISRLIEEKLDLKAPILYARKVATGKRQAWIEKQILAKGRRVLITNPIAVQTGLNNLVHFSTQLWMENPAVNPTAYRQTIGRVDRIGQNKETRIYSPVYEGTLQAQLHELLLRKVAVAISTDGLDPESALIAAGASDEGALSGLSIGKQIYALLENSV